jgi:hypothetical protein
MKKNFKLREYQEQISKDASLILDKYGFVYLAMQVRTGKTHTALNIAHTRGKQNVLFVTKKKAIYSIQEDYDMIDAGFKMMIVNYESIHKLPDDNYDMVILDEAHGMGAFPKPSKRAVEVRDVINNCFDAEVIFLSGTPTPESYSQIYHQLWVLGSLSPFAGYKNFYMWAKAYVNIKQKRIGGLVVNDYTEADVRLVEDTLKPYTMSFTQSEAGFHSYIEEEVLTVEAPEIVRSIAKRLKKDRVVEGKDEVILADTGAKLMNKMHQIYSGTVKFESGNSMVISPYKAEFIKNHFAGKKIGIFYKFVEELNAIVDVFGKENITSDVAEFDSTNKSIALQVVSGREGISLRNAEALVFYNIDYSATSYWQARDRMTTKDRKYNKVYWVFSDCGIERKIYKVVNEKKTFTLSHFEKELLSL